MYDFAGVPGRRVRFLSKVVPHGWLARQPPELLLMLLQNLKLEWLEDI
jgi:hypothetical protein